jgi:hypothetical protein
MFILRISTSVAMGSCAYLGLKYLVFFTAGKIDFHFGLAICACGSRNEPGWNGMRRHAQMPLIKREFSNNLSRHCQELFPIIISHYSPFPNCIAGPCFSMPKSRLKISLDKQKQPPYTSTSKKAIPYQKKSVYS